MEKRANPKYEIAAVAGAHRDTGGAFFAVRVPTRLLPGPRKAADKLRVLHGRRGVITFARGGGARSGMVRVAMGCGVSVRAGGSGRCGCVGGGHGWLEVVAAREGQVGVKGQQKQLVVAEVHVLGRRDLGVDGVEAVAEERVPWRTEQKVGG